MGRLAQGNDHGVRGTDDMQFISQSEVPKDKKVTYASYTCDYRHLKDEPYRVRITVGGDRLEYSNGAGSPAQSMIKTKEQDLCVLMSRIIF